MMIKILFIFVLNVFPRDAVVLNVAKSVNEHKSAVETLKDIPKRVRFVSPFGQRKIENGPLFKTDGIDEGNGDIHNFATDNVGQPIYTYIIREKRSSKKKRNKNKERKHTNKMKNILNESISTEAPYSRMNTNISIPQLNDIFNSVKKINNINSNIMKDQLHLNVVNDRPAKGNALDHTDMSFNEIYNDIILNNERKDTTNESITSSNSQNASILQNQPPNNKSDYHLLDSEVNNNKDMTNTLKVSRNIYDGDFSSWKHTTAMNSGTNIRNNYLDDNHLIVLPKPYTIPAKPISEEGIIKVLAMLTKAFKKIMKQHDDINKTYANIVDIDKDFRKHNFEINEKIDDFNEKHNTLLEYHETLKNFDTNLISRERSFLSKQKEFSETFTDLQNQQRKFISQQHDFYKIQKIILDQIEKINKKQEDISKNQSNISLQLFNTTLLNNIKHPPVEAKNKNLVNNIVKVASTPKPTPSQTKQTFEDPLMSTTQPMKINLLSLPKTKKILNLEQKVLSDKDFHTIDDIVYKYYFNNTYIDNLIKSKILNEFSETFDSKRDIQTRFQNLLNNESQIKSTHLMPINNTERNNTALRNILTRNRRWVNHETKRKFTLNTVRVFPKEANSKNIKAQQKNNISKTIENKIEDFDYDINQYFEIPKKDITSTLKPETEKIDPFAKMAKSFCNEIGLYNNRKALNRCIEKTMRKLRMIDYKKIAEIITKPSRIFEDNIKQTRSLRPTTVHSTIRTTTMANVEMLTSPPQPSNFPDNDELESKLKEYELKPDEEGNVYFDGSVHASDLPASNNDDLSGFIPGDSDSRIEIDPFTLDLQARRSAYVQRMNERLLKG